MTAYKRMGAAILDELRGRRGFDAAIDECDDDIIEEIEVAVAKAAVRAWLDICDEEYAELMVDEALG